MSINRVIALILATLIIVLMGYLISQESTNVVVEKKQISQEKPIAKVVIKSEEEQKLEDLKKQAGSTLKVSNLYVVRCSSCHGKKGEGTRVAPSIKGKSQEYILKKLDDYKNDRVSNSLMKGLLNNATALQLEELAKEISNFK